MRALLLAYPDLGYAGKFRGEILLVIDVCGRTRLELWFAAKVHTKALTSVSRFCKTC